PSAVATSRPDSEQLLAPTIATRGVIDESDLPRANSTAGGSKRSRRLSGYSGSPTATMRAPADRSAARIASGSVETARWRSTRLPDRPRRTASRQPDAAGYSIASSSSFLAVMLARPERISRASRSAAEDTNPSGQPGRDSGLGRRRAGDSRARS